MTERNPVVLPGTEAFRADSGLYKMTYMIAGEIKIDGCVPVRIHY